MAEADVEEFRVPAQFVIPHHIEDLDTAGDGGAHKELVAFRSELDALTPALGVKRVKEAGRIRGNIENGDAVMVGSQPGGHRHFPVGMEGEALDSVGHLLDHAALRMPSSKMGVKTIQNTRLILDSNGQTEEIRGQTLPKISGLRCKR